MIILMSTEEEITRLINHYGNDILRMCFIYLKDYHLAEDAAQDTFIKAMVTYKSFRHDSSEKTWLTRIAINCCKNMMRTNWFRISRHELNNTMQESFSFENSVIEKSSLVSAIMTHNTNERELILLYYYQGLSMKEISHIIRKSENATVQRVNRARNKLRNILLEAGYEKRDNKE